MQEIVLSSEKDANAVLETLRKLLGEYNHATVADYLELVAFPSSFIDQKNGWTDLKDVRIKTVDGGFVLDLPEPKKINFSNSAFPFLKGWWFVADVINDKKYEGWLVDFIGNTVILETEPSKFRIGIVIHTVMKFDAYRERPSNSE